MNIKKSAILFYLIICKVLFVVGQQNLSFNRAAYHSSSVNYNNTAHLATDGFPETFWQSNTADNEWIYVDLGKICTINKLSIQWHNVESVQFKIQISSSGTKENPGEWKDIFTSAQVSDSDFVLKINEQKARFVRIYCIKSTNNHKFAIKQFDIFGKGQIAYKNPQQTNILNNGNLYLSGGNWKVQKASFVTKTGIEISAQSFNDDSWIPATVPGTVLTSYINAGAVPDPFYGNQQFQISEHFFIDNFWYRNTFVIPQSFKNKRIWLNFDGINPKADIFINGIKIGTLKGAFIRGKFDISQFITLDKPNIVAVLVFKNDNPGQVTEQHLNDPDGNGGIIGLDSPTFLASIGWNWIPTIRGRNTGIWNHVYVNATESVSIENPFISTHLALPDTSKAYLTANITLNNHSNSTISGKLMLNSGVFTIEKSVVLNPFEQKTEILTSKEYPELMMQNPNLWWPNGYGNQHLYETVISFKINNQLSDSENIKFGVRELSYHYLNGNLHLKVNDFPIIIRGGNWGLPEGLLRCDSDGYDLRVKLHKDMNFNMIRNWVGMTAHREFYEACDKYGILIWDDFWLANPVDGPHPSDNKMFMENAVDKILQVRNHPSVALWCGRNEGYPPAWLDSALKVAVNQYDGTRHYISSSAHYPVTGLGPYEIKDPVWYFTQRGTTFHSEQGIVCPPSEESMRAMMPDSLLWPINDMWGLHDWTQPRVQIYTNDMIKSYGAPASITDFCRKARFLNTEGPKAMMETWQSNRGSGVLLWMSHPAWPSLICQTYDYFFEPSAAYFAIKNACEPIHILWRADNNLVQIANNTKLILNNLSAEVEVFNQAGIKIYAKNITVSVKPNSVSNVDTLKLSDFSGKLHFIKLTISDNNGKIISRNFYWNNSDYQNYNDFNSIAKASILANYQVLKSGNSTILKIRIENKNQIPAIMLQIKTVTKKSGQRLLPAFYSDNYISLMQNEVREITVEFDSKILNGDEPAVFIDGWNIPEFEITK